MRVPARPAALDETATVYRVPEVIGLKDTVIYASECTFRAQDFGRRSSCAHAVIVIPYRLPPLVNGQRMR